MCRLFGLTAGQHEVRATFWLVAAPDSMLAQSHRNRDGSGIGYFHDGLPVLDKQPEPAYEDPEFAAAARSAVSHSFVAHVRYATTGKRTVANTHPFTFDGQIMAHNGGFGDLPAVEAQLGDYQLQGQTDSERFAALIATRAAAHGDITAGITDAVNWLADNVPLYSLNIVLAAGHALWGLRYPDFHKLYILQREAGGPSGDRPFTGGSDQLHVHAAGLRQHPGHVLASEPLDDGPGWRLLDSGELVHIDADLQVRSTIVRAEPPAHFHAPVVDAPPPPTKEKKA